VFRVRGGASVSSTVGVRVCRTKVGKQEVGRNPQAAVVLRGMHSQESSVVRKLE
jgi:hypothetical protein